MTTYGIHMATYDALSEQDAWESEIANILMEVEDTAVVAIAGSPATFFKNGRILNALRAL
jgi:hypothetical protein